MTGGDPRIYSSNIDRVDCETGSATSFRVRHVEFRPGEFASVFSVFGPIDGSTVGDFRDELSAMVRSGARYVIIDCSHVSFINSTGLGAILQFMDKLEGHGGVLVLSNLSDKALMVVEMLGFAPTLNIVDSEAQAVQMMAEI